MDTQKEILGAAGSSSDPTASHFEAVLGLKGATAAGIAGRRELENGLMAGSLSWNCSGWLSDQPEMPEDNRADMKHELEFVKNRKKVVHGCAEDPGAGGKGSIISG